MKLLVLTRYSRLGASSRLRFFQYFPYLQEAGVELTVSPLFPDDYVQGLQKNRRDLYVVLAAYLERIRALVSAKHFDLIWIQKEAFPWLPFCLEECLGLSRTPFILDYRYLSR